MAVLRDLSLILLALGGTVVALAVVFVLAAINYGFLTIRWWQKVPYWFAVARGYLDMGQRIVERVCQAIIAPIMTIAHIQATVTGMARGLLETTGEPEAGSTPQSRIAPRRQA